MEAANRFRQAYDGLFHIRHVLWSTMAANLAVAAVGWGVSPIQILLVNMGIGILACWYLYKAHEELRLASKALDRARKRSGGNDNRMGSGD